MTIVSDTSPITNLIQINQLFLLRDLFQTVIVPQSVYEELCYIPTQRTVLDHQDWIEVAPPVERSVLEPFEKELDKGEAESIALALWTKADYLIIDEQRGRQVAQRHGVRIVGKFRPTGWRPVGCSLPSSAG